MNYVDFYKGETNYFKGELSIGRDKISGKNVDYYVLKIDDEIIYEWFGILGKQFKEKKSTAGKKPYVMLMMDNLIKENLSIDEIGCLVKLASHIEWGTGRAIHKKSKKPMSKGEIESVLGVSHNTWSKLTKKLKEKNLLTVNKDGYFISTELIKKGKTK